MPKTPRQAQSRLHRVVADLAGQAAEHAHDPPVREVVTGNRRAPAYGDLPPVGRRPAAELGHHSALADAGLSAYQYRRRRGAGARQRVLEQRQLG